MAKQITDAGVVNKSTRITSGAVAATYDDNVINLTALSTVTLPAITSTYIGFVLYIQNDSVALATVNPTGGDTINGVATYATSEPGMIELRVESATDWSASFSGQSPSAEYYDALVAADGTGDYLLPSAAIAGGANTMFIKDGLYPEVVDLTLTNGMHMVGESTEGVQITFTGGVGIVTATQIPKSGGTISITNDTDVVTGVGTSFLLADEGKYILLGKEYYKVKTYTSATSITLEDLYRGKTLAAVTYSLQTMTTGVQLQNFSVIGTDGVTVNVDDNIRFNYVLYGTIENIFCKTTELNCIELNGCGNITVIKVVATDAGNGGTFGTGIHVAGGNNIKLSGCNASNNNHNGATLSGSATTCEASHFNNNGRHGVETVGNNLGPFIIDDCFAEGNVLNGFESNGATDSVSVTNCATTNNGSNGIRLQGDGNTITGNVSIGDPTGIQTAGSTTVSGNHIVNSTSHSIHINGDQVVIDGNVITNAGLRGIYVSTQTDIRVCDNIINTTGNPSIELNGACVDCYIGENTILNAATYGISISAAATGTKVGTNVIKNSGTGDYQDLAADTQFLVVHPTGISNGPTINAAAALEVQSTTQGFLLPRMTAAQGTALATPANGLMIYVTDTDVTFAAPGIYGYENGFWVKL